MTNDDRWLLAVIVVECAAAAMMVVDGGDSGRRRRRWQGARGTQARADEGARARVDEGARARAMAYMADNNGKQQERASDNGAARRLSSKIHKIGVTTPQYLPVFDVVACAHSHPKNSGSRVTQLKIADTSKPHQKLVPVCIRGVPICVRGVRQKNSHMGRHITHNEVVRIWGLTYMLIPECAQLHYA